MVDILGLSMSGYTVVMLVFFLFLVLVLILGDIGDIGFDTDVDADVDTGVSPLSLPVIGVFGTAFGGFGTLFESLGYGVLLTPILAVILATLTAGGMWVVMLNVFVKTQAETRVSMPELVGFKGQVMVPIRPGHPGQILVITEARGRTLLQAIADEAIDRDEHVVVEALVGNSVKVHKV